MPVTGRGSLPFLLVHGESCVAAASFGLEAAEVELLDAAAPWESVRDLGRGLVLHDPACPLTPPAFLAEAVRACRDSGAIVVGVRPVTDTVKEIDASGLLGQTLDRTALVAVASPIVLPPTAVAALPSLPEQPFDQLVEALATRWSVTYLTAPALARRLPDDADGSDVALLEALRP